jgi:SAM-dependent methyltransferase
LASDTTKTIDSGQDALTEGSFWDAYWEGFSLPAEFKQEPGNTYGNAILDVFDKNLPHDPRLTAAELGGSPGQYLAYVHKSLGYRVTCIDYSRIGCQKTVENFTLLGIDGDVIQADIFDDDVDLPLFDVVYSLGLIEHFKDRTPVVERHVRLIKPGGYLVLGVPNFRGIHGWFMRRLAPTLYAAHEIDAMNLGSWVEFEKRFSLDVVFKGYVGGFEPLIFKRREVKGAKTIIPFAIAVGIALAVHSFLGFVRRFNGPRLSGYAMAVYRLPSVAPRAGART